MRSLILAAVTWLLTASAPAFAQDAAAPVFEVKLEAPVTAPVSGRLIIVAIRPEDRWRPGPAPARFDDEALLQRRSEFLRMAAILGMSPSPIPTTSTIATGADVTLAPGQTIDIGAGAATYPTQARYLRGGYFVQAILDVDGDYAYNNKPSAGDLVSDVVAVDLPLARAALPLKTLVAAPIHPWDRPAPTLAAGLPTTVASQTMARYETARETSANAARVDVPSAVLTAFHGRPVGVRAYVLTPPGYAQGADRYPVVFRTEGFGGSFNGATSTIEAMWQAMKAGRHPPMIWVFLDHSGPTGTHEFADSANNGPWGQALTEEFIPWLDAHYRTDPKNRFTTGHSSGGWAALWLQVRYPKVFAGAWPTAPDPVDFRDFTNVDIYAPGANTYVRNDGAPVPLQRVYRSDDTVPFRAYADLERVLGKRGGQLASFEWVFSPRGPDGAPVPLFDRDTGAVDPAVAAYWRDNYDISHIIRRDWTRLKPDLDGKVHLWVGTRDTYFLESPARLLKASLDDLGARSDFHFVEGADHGTLGAGPGPDGTGINFGALEQRLAWEMYRQARPDSPLKEPPRIQRISGAAPAPGS